MVTTKTGKMTQWIEADEKITICNIMGEKELSI